MSLEFLITAMIVVLIPGTGVVYTVATGLGHGRRASIVAAFGCTLGILPHLLASIFGLAAILHTSALVFQAVKWAGIAYLLYLAVQTLRDRGPVRFAPRHGAVGGVQLVRTGIALNMLNPKLSIFFLAFLPQFVSQTGQAAIFEMLTLACVFMGMTFVVFVIYGQLAGLMRDKILSSKNTMNWMRRISATAFGFLGLRLMAASN